jgi:glycosyltransferase involved in cell wall biosynthesis
VIARRADVVFVIAGYGPLEHATLRAIAAAGIADRVRMLGLRDDVELVYAALDVLLSTSRWEGLPRVAVEAIASGVPVVASDVGGCAEVIVPGRTGVLAAAADVDALSRAVTEALDAELAPAIDLDEHDVRHVVAQHVALYAELGSRCTS